MERVAFVHEQIDCSLKLLFEDEVISRCVTCKRGCAGCCYTQVSVTHDESQVLSQLMQSGVIKLDFSLLDLQRLAGNSGEKWYQMSFPYRRCLFLNSANECSIYQYRPAVCRTNYVISDPAQCFTYDGKERPVSLLKTDQANIIIAAAYSFSGENGALPFMLWKSMGQKMEHVA